ncbi:hypothetical protein GCM10023196_001370 [Actinoallomurus vinaceus]|uniref:Lipoprotein n=1 Tax=Actinoallomurus vinaceus TaxID=1080074 RepID=A0ABP8U2U6_9ACTN
MFRPLIPLVVLACAGGLVACSGKADPSRQHGVSPSTAALCPSAAEVVKLMDAEMNPEKYRVADPVVCDHGWAAAHVQLTTAESDQTQVVLHYTAGQWHGVASGLEGLCHTEDMRGAPAAIREALGSHC